MANAEWMQNFNPISLLETEKLLVQKGLGHPLIQQLLDIRRSNLQSGNSNRRPSDPKTSALTIELCRFP